MKTAKLTALSVIGLIFTFAACTKDLPEPDRGSNDMFSSMSLGPGGDFPDPHPEAIDLARENMAKALAKALTRQDVRTFLQGHFETNDIRELEIPYVLIALETIGEETFAEILYSESDTSVGENFFSSDIFMIDPLISFTLHTENEEVSGWDASTVVPNTVYVPHDFEDGIQTGLDGFDHEGTPVGYDSDNEPEETVIVVNMSETVVASITGTENYWADMSNKMSLPCGSLARSDSCFDVASFSFTNPFTGVTYTFTDRRLYYECCDGTGGGGSGGGTPIPCTNCNPAQRDSRENMDRFFSARFNSRQATFDVESWVRGRWLEIEGYCIYTDAQGNTSYRKIFFEAKRKDLINGHVIKNPARFVINWDQSLYGDNMRYVLYERDFSPNNTDSRSLYTCIEQSGYEVTKSFPVRTGGNLGGNWKLVADLNVEYCDDVNWPSQKVYNGSKMKFTLTEPW